MHELGIVYEIIKTVDDVMQQQNLTEIQSISLDVGEMCDIVPSFLKEAWQAAKSSTAYPNARFEINTVTAKAKCKKCGYISAVRELGLTCPNCTGEAFEIISGKEFEIRQIVAK